MKPYKHSKVSKETTSRKEYNIVTRDQDPYWDEGINFYPKYRRGFKNPNRLLMSYQIRMYRTWKYNRKTQWK